jgi:DNA-binding NarL/FixJ family response regulator
LIEEAGIREPGVNRVHADSAEAALALGDVGRAERIADFLETHGERTQHRWSLATAARTRALIAASRGELAVASSACELALARHETLSMPLELGRTLLAQGVIARRMRRRARAKESFDRALDLFESHGARLWADRARAELDRVGLRRAGDELTHSERSVAELASRGLTRKQVAAALHVSPKTVDATLARAYRKLGIGSRAELGARMVQLQK